MPDDTPSPPEFEALRAYVAARLRPVCPDLSDAVFIDLVTRIVEVRLHMRRAPDGASDHAPDRAPERHAAPRARSARHRSGLRPAGANGGRSTHSAPLSLISYARPPVLPLSDDEVSDGPGARARPRTPSREVWDATAGVHWRVTEHDPPPHLADRCTHCLIYDSGGTVRRVCGQGADWHQRSDAELLALCHAPR